MVTKSISTHTIRNYQDADLPAVLSSWENASRLAHPFMDEKFLAQVKEDIPALYIPNAETWVCEADLGQGTIKVVGFISLMGSSVAALFVEPDQHGKGYGRALMDKASELHSNKLDVDVFEANAIGRHFYETYGFSYDSDYIFESLGEKTLKLKLGS